jgi:hypothetical protein
MCDAKVVVILSNTRRVLDSLPKVALGIDIVVVIIGPKPHDATNEVGVRKISLVQVPNP